VFSTLRNGTWRNDLIKRLVTRDHAEIAPSTLLERLHTALQITHFGCELPVALAQPVIFASLRRNCRLETMQLADTVLGQPHTVLQEHYDDEQGCGEPLHGRDSIKRGGTREAGAFTATRPDGNYLVECSPRCIDDPD
jgi:hypothetical protein